MILLKMILKNNHFNFKIPCKVKDFLEDDTKEIDDSFKQPLGVKMRPKKNRKYVMMNQT